MGEILKQPSKRNSYVDVIRGVAMLLVVLGHTMTGVTEAAENTVLFNIIWSLQMPLFILVSGYVTKFGRYLNDCKSLFNFILKRTTTYIVPWIVWTFLIRGLLFGKSHFFNIGYLVYHMDSGYWFLTTIWIINVVFGISLYLAGKIARNRIVLKQIITIGFYGLGFCVIAGVGLLLSFEFFGIKYIVYYMPFYALGYLYGQNDDKIMSIRPGAIIKDIVIAVCLAYWVFILGRYNIYIFTDGLFDLALRASSSLAGCIVICGLLKGVFIGVNYDNEEAFKPYLGMVWIGQHSLEIYVCHNLFLSLIVKQPVPVANSLMGILIIVLNYAVTICVTVIVVKMISYSRSLKIFLFGNRK